MFRISALLAVAVVVSACGPGVDVDREREVIDDPYTYSVFQSASDGHISGQVGPIENVNTAVENPTVFSDANYAAITLAAQVDTEHAVMLFLSSFDPENILPGQSYFADRNNDDYGDSMFSLLGCVGQGIDIYDQYDAPADTLTVDVTGIEDTQDIVLDVTATWLDRTSGVTEITAFGTVTLHQ